MFKGQPKGLYALALANTGERFGYYTMLAIFVLYLQAKFGFDAAASSSIYSWFLAAVYFMPLVGGILADKFGYNKMVTTGIIIMFFGYVLLAFPVEDTISEYMMYGALAAISVGTGLFKGNLQVMVGNLYDTPELSSKRDSAFSLFYMAINIGALFAPGMATWITNVVLKSHNFTYNAEIPALAHKYIDGTLSQAGETAFENLRVAQHYTGDLASFGQTYIDTLSGAYNWGFAVACISLVLSMAIYLVFKKTFTHTDIKKGDAASANATTVVPLTRQQTRARVTALMLVFLVVIFFWMAFHQNGLTMTFFARDYTVHEVSGLDRLGFNVLILALVVVTIYSAVSFFQSDTRRAKLISGIVGGVSIIGIISQYNLLPESMSILPQTFAQFNPFFVVALTPFSLLLFTSLANKGKEPSAPRKIGMGMFVAALGFVFLAVCSYALPNPVAIQQTPLADVDLVSTNWLISTYLVLTFAELLLSPMGISFVSKVAPPKLKGAMMGSWFVATAIGNKLTGVPGYLWESGIPLWMIWGILIVLCLVSAIFIFSIMKKLENATSD
ncbi:MAG: peptide MFS transporter [Bacteroidaceae bacterium]